MTIQRRPAEQPSYVQTPRRTTLELTRTGLPPHVVTETGPELETRPLESYTFVFAPREVLRQPLPLEDLGLGVRPRKPRGMREMP